MKAKTREKGKARAEVAPPPRRTSWLWALGAVLAVAVVFQVYGPVLQGPFVFDDDYLPFRLPRFGDSLRNWTMGFRPLLMFTYWLNYRISPTETLWYHVFNLLFHSGAGLMMFYVLRRLLALAEVEEKRRTLLAAFGAGVFLLHPVQTESVAYVASRSENLSVLLFFAAYAVFLCRTEAVISWRRAVAVLALAGAAVATKEHTIMLPALLLLTDYYWNPGFSFNGMRRNWRVYAPFAAVAVGGAVLIRDVLVHSPTAGFGMKGLPWYEYFFTQWRALFVYLRLFVLPYGQSIDYDFPFSRTVFDHGAIVGLSALAAITVAAWVWRRRYPLASFGWFAFLILMAPTSSFVPIKDPVAERRMYLSMFGLLLIALEFLRRVRLRGPVLAASAAGVLLVFSVLAYQRNLVWSDRIALWEDTVRKAPRNARAEFQLAFSYFEQGHCAEAVPHYQRAVEIQGPTYEALVDWALAYDCLNQADQAIAKLRQAAGLERSAHAWSLIGMVNAKNQHWQEALDALAEAERIDPRYVMTYVYRGGIRLAQNAAAAAVAEYRRALAIDPGNELARAGLVQAEQRLRTM